MFHRTAQRRPSRRVALVAGAALALAFLPPLASAAGSHAAVLGPIETSMEIDGNHASDNPGGVDWDDFLTLPVVDLGNPTQPYSVAFTPTGPYAPASGGTSVGIIDGSFAYDEEENAAADATLIEIAEAACGGLTETGFDGGAKLDDDPWAYSAGVNTNYKGDISAMAAGLEVVTVGGDDHIILYQAWWRQCSTGEVTTYLVLEGPTAGRDDDYLIEFNYDDSDYSTSIDLLSWTGTEWVSSSDPVVYEAEVGINDLVPDEWLQTGGNDGTGTFGELAIDLTASGLFAEGECDVFTPTGLITETGEGNDPALIDWGAFPADKQVALHNCGSLVVEKNAVPASATSDDIFEYSVGRSGDGVVHESEAVPPAGVTDTDDSVSGITAAIGVGDSHQWLVFAGDDYTIEEAAIADELPWVFQSLTCTVTPPGTDEPVNYIITSVEDEFPMYVGAETVCVITNATSFLTVTKTVDGSEEQAFGFDVSPAGTTPDATSEVSLFGNTVSSPIQFKPGTEVTVTELLDAVNSGNGDEADWTLTDITGGTPDLENASTAITTVAGQTVNVTFTNAQDEEVLAETGGQFASLWVAAAALLLGLTLLVVRRVRGSALAS